MLLTPIRKRVFVPIICAALLATAVFFISASAHTEIKIEKDILFDTRNGIELKGDIYVPDGGGPFPGILFIHGGGFVNGTKDGAAHAELVTYFVERGYAVFNANYRLFKDNGIFPNSIKDAKCALAWMKTDGVKYGVDPGRLATMGESAGAYLAAMVAMTPDEPDMRPDCPLAKGVDLSVKAGVLFYPPTDFSTFQGGFINIMEIEIRRAVNLKTKKQTEEYKKKYSPVTYVNNAPPLFISYSDPDHTVPTQQGRELVEKLKKAGRIYDAQEVSGPGMNHGFILIHPDAPQSVEAKKRAIALLDKYVKNSNKAAK